MPTVEQTIPNENAARRLSGDSIMVRLGRRRERLVSPAAFPAEGSMAVPQIKSNKDSLLFLWNCHAGCHGSVRFAIDMKTMLCAALCLLLGGVVLAQEAAVGKRLQEVKLGELPGAAASLVKRAKPAELEQTTVLVVRKALRLNPAAAAVLIGTVARAVPAAAARAAGTAAQELPDQSVRVARAAALAAPAEAARIVEAVWRAAPEHGPAVAVVVAGAVPGATREVLWAVAAVAPEFKATIEAALAAGKFEVISVAKVLTQAMQGAEAHTANGPGLLGPQVGPPFLPLAGTVSTLTPDTSEEAATGGRDYARP